MRLSKTTEYAIRAMAFLARNNQAPVSVAHLSETLDIPYKYLARLMTQLSQAGLLESTQGKRGGYRISRPLEEIRLSHVVDVVEGLENFHRCILGHAACEDHNPCSMHHLWGPQIESARCMIYDNTLADLRQDTKF
jgi:Rrf2 family protein